MNIVTNNYFPNGGSLQANATFAKEQQALYDAGEPSAFDLTAGTGNLQLQLPLSNWTSKWESITSMAKAFDPAEFLGESPPSSVLQGFKKQRSVILREMNNIAVSGVSWNTDWETRIYMTRPFSRGSIKIHSTNVLDSPLIDYAAIVDPTDLEILYNVYLKNRDIMSSPEISTLGPIEIDPAPGNLTSEAEIKEAIKKYLAPSNAHQCCTASMMAQEDGGVVDSLNQVYGVERLSVVDASIWPINVGNAPQASVYAGAEKVSHITSHFREDKLTQHVGC
jgi:choline dehydrogenase